MRPALIGICLALGLSSALLEWANRIAAQPATAYVLVFPILLLVAGRSLPTTPPDPRAGLAWIAGAIAVQLLATGGDIERVARLALPLGVIGFLRFTGALASAPAALAFFIVPVPHAIAAAAPLDKVWRAFAELLIGPVGSSLGMSAWDSGARLVALFAGIGWYAAARRGASWRGSVRRAAQLAMLGLPVQLGAVVVAVAIAKAGRPGWARLFLTHGVWLLSAAVTVAAVEISRSREAREVDV